MTPLLWITGIIGGLLIGAGLGLAVLLIMNRREIKRRADEQRRARLWAIEHYDT